MARIRSIKPELRTSLTVSSWPREVRYFFVLLWGYLDDYGRGVDDELLIASDCFPRDRDLTPERIDDWLELIADSGPLCRYEVDGRRYLHAPNWREHQKPSHPTRSKVPPCPEDEPAWFKEWREDNPQRLRSRSRKSREGFQKIPDMSPRGAERPSGGRSERASGRSSRDAPTSHDAEGGDASEGGNAAGQATFEASPESLPKTSGNAPENFAPEQGSKGAREQGGVGGSDRPSTAGSSGRAKARPDGRLSLDDSDFELNDTMRRWAVSTFGSALDIEHETAQFVSHYRAEGTRKRSWPDEWQKWMRRASKYASERQNRPHLRAVAGQTPEERGIF